MSGVQGPAQVESTNRAEPFGFKYRPGLDALRGVAILMVMAFHFWEGHFPGGYVGVDLFFVISGYVITGLLLAEVAADHRINLKRFYWRRVVRLFPALYLLLLVEGAEHVMSPSPARADGFWASMSAVVLYVSNWRQVFGSTVPGRLGHLWSLSIEEQFYMLWPLMLLWLVHRGVRGQRLVAVCGTMFVLTGLYRAVTWTLAGPDRCYFGTDTHSDGLWLGAAVAALGNVPRPGLILRLAAGGLLLFFGLTQSRESAFPYLLGLSLANLAAATLVAASLGPSTARSLQWIGKISYSLYLWHQPVGLALSHLMASASLIGIGTKTVVSVAAACGSYYGIEKPCLALKNRLPP